MRKGETALLAVALVALLGGGVGLASAATPGSAVYSIHLASSGQSHSLTVNETVAATSSPSSDTLILKIAAQTWNLNYSRSINSSSDVSPFIPSITNQTFSYGSGANSVTISVVENGTLSINFQGHQYTLTSYSLSASGVDNGSSIAITGALTTFPSGLVQSLRLSSNGLSLPASEIPNVPANVTSSAGPVSVSATLLSTSLPLTADSPSTVGQDASIGLGAGAAASALALGLGVRHRGKSKAAAPQQNPEHWVD